VGNLKRIRRVYSEANLQVRRRIRRRLALGRGNLAAAASSMNERWSLDFVHDTLSSKRRIRALTIVDDFTHESLAIEVDTALSGERVSRVLDAIAAARGYPATIVLDNGPELTSLTMLRWASERRVRLITSLQENQPKTRLLKASTASFATSVSTKMTSRI